MNTLYFILTALLASVTTLIAPRIIHVTKRYYTRKKQSKTNLHQRIEELESKIEVLNNIAQYRERNQRAKIRKEVDLYLNELRND